MTILTDHIVSRKQQRVVAIAVAAVIVVSYSLYSSNTSITWHNPLDTISPARTPTLHHAPEKDKLIPTAVTTELKPSLTPEPPVASPAKQAAESPKAPDTTQIPGTPKQETGKASGELSSSTSPEDPTTSKVTCVNYEQLQYVESPITINTFKSTGVCNASLEIPADLL